MWAISYSLIAVTLLILFPKFKGSLKYAVALAAIGSFLYVLFIVNVDVPMYLSRWQADVANGKKPLSFAEGIYDLKNGWLVTYQIDDWKEVIPWMSLYFRAAVWTSIALCYVPLTETQLQRHLKLSKKLLYFDFKTIKAC